MMRKILIIPVLLGFQAPAAAPEAWFDVMKYGAVADRNTNAAAAIQKAIDACAKAGGGTVYLPAGNYLSGSLELKSNVTLHLSPGAVLWGSRRFEDYPGRALIWARNADNIAIAGKGTIDGQDEAYFEPNFGKPKADRPTMVLLNKCTRVRIEGVTLRYAPAWTIHPKDCDGVWIRGIKLLNHVQAFNTDGIDLDSCRNVHISDSYIEAGDDSFVLKTTQPSDGSQAGPCENVTVTNCVLISSASGFKLGTESHGDFRHIVVSNCVIRRTWAPLSFFLKDGGAVENVSFSNITIHAFPEGRGYKVTWPIFVDLDKRWPDQTRLSSIRDISFSNIRILGKGRSRIAGMPERPIENVTLRNIVMRVDGFEPIEEVRKPGGGRSQPARPEADFGSIPAEFIFAHIRGLDVDDVQVIWDTKEEAQERHAIWGKFLDGVRIHRFSGRQAVPDGKLPVIAFEDVKNVFVTESSAAPGAGVFLKVPAAAKSEVLLDGNDLRKARVPVEYAP